MGARARACACKRECRRGEVTEEKFRRYICRLVGMNRSRPPTQSTEPLATGSARHMHLLPASSVRPIGSQHTVKPAVTLHGCCAGDCAPKAHAPGSGND